MYIRICTYISARYTQKNIHAHVVDSHHPPIPSVTTRPIKCLAWDLYKPSIQNRDEGGPKTCAQICTHLYTHRFMLQYLWFVKISSHRSPFTNFTLGHTGMAKTCDWSNGALEGANVEIVMFDPWIIQGDLVTFWTLLYSNRRRAKSLGKKLKIYMNS